MRTEGDDILESAYSVAWHVAGALKLAGVLPAQSLRLLLLPSAMSSVLTLLLNCPWSRQGRGMELLHGFCAAYKDMSPLTPHCSL